jgi:hypothetical protein
MDYECLRIEIRSEQKGGFKATLLEAPGEGRSETALALPFAPEVLARIKPRLERAVRDAAGTLAEHGAGPEGAEAADRSPPPSAAAGPGPLAAAEVVTAAASPAPDEPEPPGFEEIGRGLSEALFGTALGDAFRRCVAEVTSRPGARRGVAVRIQFRRDDPALAALSSIPWELLIDTSTGGHLARSIDTPLVRDIDVEAPDRPLAVDPPLRVLVVDPNPRHPALHRLDLEAEKKRIRRGIRRAGMNGRIEVRSVEPATLDGLVQKLDEPFHVVHFMGHGGFSAGYEEGLLAFERPDGSPHWVTASMFAEHLKLGVEEPRLVVLNACNSGLVPRWRGLDPLAAAAPTLLRRWFPAVVATQFPITDAAATAFAEAFYGALARAEPLEAAVTRGRLAIQRETGSGEWVTPMLFLHARDGRLLARPPAPRRGKRRGAAAEPRVAAGGAARPVPARQPRRSAPRSRKLLRLGIHGDEGWADHLASENDRVLSLAELFEDGEIRRRRDWAGAVAPRVRAFLHEAMAERRPLRLDLATPATVAFLCGWLLEARSGVAVTVRKRTLGRDTTAFDFAPGDGSTPEGRLWLDAPDVEHAPGAADLALAVSVGQPVLEDVETYLLKRALAVTRIVQATVAPGPGPRTVGGGDHALELTQQLVPRAARRTPAERAGTLHLFAAAPNALLFYLGQLAHGLGRTTMYEYDFDSLRPGAYTSSLTFPL